MNLADYFALPTEIHCKATPATGEHTDWLEFCNLDLKGSRVLVVDAQFVPSEKDGLLVELPPATYLVQAKVANYGGDRRFSRVRVFRAGSGPQPGGKIGETWTDTATTGICDFEVFSKAWGSDEETADRFQETQGNASEDFGVAVLDADAGAVMPFVHSGFGDGSFSVFELTEHGQRVGFEIEFIAGDAKYPFKETPYARWKTRVQPVEARAQEGDPEAQLQMGQLYHAGKEVARDMAVATEWYERAAENGSAEAAVKLGLIFKAGKSRPQDLRRAKELFELAAARGSISALNQLGVAYRYGHGVEVDYEKAVAYFREAAEKGQKHARFNLAIHYDRGLGVAQNHTEAVKLYRLAAEQGLWDAAFNLGCLLLRGEPGVAKDEPEAVKLFKVGAANDHAGCANNLAHCYEKGCGTEKNPKLALIWYAAAARRGVVMAKCNLGLLYKSGGEGVGKDPTAALKWLREAAAEGSARAGYHLGLLYETGEFVAANRIEAHYFYEKAAAGGFARAAEKLRQLASKLSDSERAAVAVKRLS